MINLGKLVWNLEEFIDNGLISFRCDVLPDVGLVGGIGTTP